MTTRKAMEKFLSKCEQTLEFAEEQYIDGLKQGHYMDNEYSQAQAMLEDAYNELLAIYRSSNSQQRERLHRMRLKIQDLQNKMTLLDHR